jgi:hypothetical protein
VTTSSKVTPRKSDRLSPSGGQLSGHAPLLRCGPGNGTLYSRTVAMRSLICASSSVSLARDPTGSPEGHQAWRIVASSKERVHKVRVCCACVASLGGRSSEIRATGQPVVCDGVFCRVLAQVVSAGSALTAILFAGCLTGWFGSFHGRLPEFVSNPGRHLWSDRGFSPLIEVSGCRVVTSVAARPVLKPFL